MVKIFIIIFLFFISFESLVFAKETPQRIVSLGPVVTEEVYLLGAEDKLVANTIYCTRPFTAKKKQKIGTVTRANIEKIVSLRPDLVTSIGLSNPKQMEKLKRLGINVVDFPTVKTFSQICAHFLKLGRVLGKEEKANDIINYVVEKVDSIKKDTKNSKKLKVFIQIGAKPLVTINKDSFINDIIDFAGGVNIAVNSKTGSYSREKVITSNPDVIFIASMGILGEDEKNIWKKYKTINAVKNNRIYVLDAKNLCSLTPVSFVEILEEIRRYLD
jgi:iron complex transport system substrate-binding protein